jgi:hypothetical protein
MQDNRLTIDLVRIQFQYSLPSICYVELVPRFFLSTSSFGVSSKALVGHQALNYHHIFYYEVCNIVDVVKAALVANSYALVVCHNHPSGSHLYPSTEDIQTTRQLLRSAKILGVHLLDHLILSPTEPAYSIRENYPELWQDDG